MGDIWDLSHFKYFFCNFQFLNWEKILFRASCKSTNVDTVTSYLQSLFGLQWKIEYFVSAYIVFSMSCWLLVPLKLKILEFSLISLYLFSKNVTWMSTLEVEEYSQIATHPYRYLTFISTCKFSGFVYLTLCSTLT